MARSRKTTRKKRALKTKYTVKPINTNRTYKSSVFSSLFSEYPEELPKVIPLTIQPNIKIEDVTLDNVLFMEQINDLALLVGSVLLLFFEHQSTINYNISIFV